METGRSHTQIKSAKECGNIWYGMLGRHTGTDTVTQIMCKIVFGVTVWWVRWGGVPVQIDRKIESGWEGPSETACSCV